MLSNLGLSDYQRIITLSAHWLLNYLHHEAVGVLDTVVHVICNYDEISNLSLKNTNRTHYVLI